MSYVFVPPLTVMLHTEDITDRNQAEKNREAMAQSEKLRAMGKMATGIAPDLNQSLMLVASYSDLARQALVQDPPNLVELEDLLTTSTQAALDGGESVKRLLLFTRAAPEHDRQPVGVVRRLDMQTNGPPGCLGCIAPARCRELRRLTHQGAQVHHSGLASATPRVGDQFDLQRG